jgi:hypothetical protein
MAESESAKERNAKWANYLSPRDPVDQPGPAASS